MAVIIRGASTNHGAEVSEDGQLSVANPPRLDGEDSASYPVGTNPPGFVVLSCRADPGTQTGQRIMRENDINEDYALRVALDGNVFEDRFTGTEVNVNLWEQTSNGMTISVANDFCSLNTLLSTSPGNYAVVRSWRSFPLPAGTSNYFSIRAKITNAVVPGAVMEFGVGYAVGDGLATNGVFFRWTSAGELRGVLNNDGIEIETPPFETIPDDENHYYLISYTAGQVQFWIDDVLYGVIYNPSTTSSPCNASSLPFLFRVYNVTTPSAPRILHIASCQFAQGGPNIQRDLDHVQAGNGAGNYQGQTGWSSLGQTAKYVLDTAPDLAVLSGAVPSFDTLGGQFQFEVPDASEDDYILYGWKNPNNNNNQKQLYIHKIIISTINIGDTIGGTPVILEWAVGIGGTDADIHSVDGPASKAPRIIPITFQTFPAGSPAGFMPSPIAAESDTPLVIDPGQYVHLMFRVISGNSGTYQVIRGNCAIRGHFE